MKHFAYNIFLDKHKCKYYILVFYVYKYTISVNIRQNRWNKNTENPARIEFILDILSNFIIYFYKNYYPYFFSCSFNIMNFIHYTVSYDRRNKSYK